MIAHLSPKERFGYACLVGLLLFAFGFIGARHLRQPAPIVFESPSKGFPEPNSATQSLASTDSKDLELVVHVSGAVAKPGIVRLAQGARVMDAIEEAGGPLPSADLDSINLAERAEDGTQIRVALKSKSPSSPSRFTKRSHPKTGFDTAAGFAPVLIEPTQLGAKTEAEAESTKSQPTRSSAKKVTSVVAVNSASVEELQSLPGVGPTTAQKIIAFRQQNGQFKSVEELLDVPGIGEKKLAKMRPFVKI
jgi:competence protein ComEA